MPFEMRIALRYLTARRKQAFISLISAISMLGVIVGVIAPFIAPWVSRAGNKRIFLFFYGARKIVAGSLLLAPWILR